MPAWATQSVRLESGAWSECGARGAFGLKRFVDVGVQSLRLDETMDDLKLDAIGACQLDAGLLKRLQLALHGAMDVLADILVDARIEMGLQTVVVMPCAARSPMRSSRRRLGVRGDSAGRAYCFSNVNGIQINGLNLTN